MMHGNSEFVAEATLDPPTAQDWVLVFDAALRLRHSPSQGLFWSWSEVIAESMDSPDARVSVGRIGDKAIYAVKQDQEDADGADPRRLLSELSPSQLMALSAGKQRLHWLMDHRFCGRCAGRTVWHHQDVALFCPQCNHRYFPRLAPCIIVAVRDGGHLLLGRSHRHPPDLWSLIAGFIEPGESAEQAVHREVAEETGIAIANLRYMGSESWPFPHQLMLGYVADFHSGELVRARDELADLAWFPVDDLPRVPGAWTIAGRLIRSLAGAPERSQ